MKKEKIEQMAKERNMTLEDFLKWHCVLDFDLEKPKNHVCFENQAEKCMQCFLNAEWSDPDEVDSEK